MLLKSKRGRKGQADATSASALIAVIAALIIIYLLFLPPDVRDDLISPNKTNESENTSASNNLTLLLENPQHISYVSQTEYEHSIPVFSLFKTTNSINLVTENPFYIKNSWTGSTIKDVSFNVPDLSNTDNVVLSFVAAKHKGILTITLNGVVVFQDSIPSYNIAPIKLDKRVLQNSNVLEFSVNGVGAAFWSTNEYMIQNLQINGESTDLSRQSSKTVITLKEVEKFNLESALLKFYPDCVDANVGVLDVTINGFNIYSGVPDCRTLNRINIPIGLLDTGENTVSFKTNQGSYLIDQSKVVTYLKDSPLVIYYFDVSSTQNNWIQNNTYNAVLTINLVKTGETKEANFIINGHTTSMRTDKDTYTKNLPKEWFFEGSDYLRIVPKDQLDISVLKIELKK